MHTNHYLTQSKKFSPVGHCTLRKQTSPYKILYKKLHLLHRCTQPCWKQRERKKQHFLKMSISICQAQLIAQFWVYQMQESLFYRFYYKTEPQNDEQLLLNKKCLFLNSDVFSTRKLLYNTGKGL